MNVCWAVSIKCHCQTSSNIAYMCTFVYLPQILNYWLSLSLRPLSHKDLHPYHSYHPSYPHKECPPSRFSGAPSVSVCPGRRAPGLRSTESKFWISRNCVMFLLYFLTATLSNCQLNYCKMLHKFWESCISSSKASSFIYILFILCNNMYQLEHKLISKESILSLSMTIN